MTTNPSSDPNSAVRRVVLVDFDWQDADLIPLMLRRPGVRVRLVVGNGEDDTGLRAAELCGVPRTLELSDLTREIFDVALIGGQSRRFDQVVRLLTALGTPVMTPQTFMNGSPHPGTGEPGAISTAEAADPDLDEALARALPDLSEETTAVPAGPEQIPDEDLETGGIPSPDDTAELERLLARWVDDTGARCGELHVVSPARAEWVARSGPHDSLLGTLVHLALQLAEPQVMVCVEGPEKGRAWGAWPFRTRVRRGALAAGGIDLADGRAVWEQAAARLRDSWERHERAALRARSAAAPSTRQGWLSPEAFGCRLESAVKRNGCDGLRYAVHRLHFGGPPECVEDLCRRLPNQLRENDCICHPTSHDVLLLSTGSPGSFEHVRRRIVRLWEQAWTAGGQVGEAPPVTGERADLSAPENAEEFQATSRRWLAGEATER